ncbi:MAG: 16S rRNA (cytosine(1402)-N(4))-methyltransferase RsmH [Bacteroidota bacterium]
MEYHVPVLLKESIEGLAVRSDCVYVDLTFGGGGHTKAILEDLTTGKVFSFDQDEDARKNAEKINHRSFTFVEANFRDLKRYLKLHGIDQVDGILADLGISSHQIDDPSRGFSTRFEGELDMRMSQHMQTTAQDVINGYDENALHRIFGMYGEVKNAKTLAAAIVSARINQPIKTISDLKAILDKYAKRGKEFKYYAQVFQAIRIEVNQEMQALEEALNQSVDLIKKGGRLVMISYHSLEDRMVKNFIAKGKVHGEVEKDFYGNVIKPFQAVNRKPIEASEAEIKENNRARSAKLRIAERI